MTRASEAWETWRAEMRAAWAPFHRQMDVARALAAQVEIDTGSKGRAYKAFDKAKEKAERQLHSAWKKACDKFQATWHSIPRWER